MLIINLKPGEHIDRALKRYKQKVRKTKQIQNLRERQQFTKPSAARRVELAKAKYKLEYERRNEE
ncbi:30S ribosomal protein S21 [Robertkochia sediminum]|uniref:30S ribosomal protein S21 n=1 Tax=Robertkochia sediminum TaxID=2785326 RepID=UPI0019336560|nr:30S ribosomal protein S21 [Robertkochia sediminum]MBL7471515.1 30S ribosomal protein S21 [Robertkochia sediminum]